MIAQKKIFPFHIKAYLKSVEEFILNLHHARFWIKLCFSDCSTPKQKSELICSVLCCHWSILLVFFWYSDIVYFWYFELQHISRNKTRLATVLHFCLADKKGKVCLIPIVKGKTVQILRCLILLNNFNSVAGILAIDTQRVLCFLRTI